ncbi:hypothetical protein, partial [Escherichia coli]|uniref:hypothetical protein n=1 Tax=Escherichia coli TaxID=562 RepID=UPI0006C8CB7E
SELLLCHGMVCVVGRMRDLILQLSKSSIYSTKPQVYGKWMSENNNAQVALLNTQLSEFAPTMPHNEAMKN